MYMSFRLVVPLLPFILSICKCNDETICQNIRSSTFHFDNYRRDYSYYYPSILCDTTQLTSFVTTHMNAQPFNPSTHRINLPILLIIHGFTDNPKQFLSHWKWQLYAEQYGYILLLPKGGVNNAEVPSWNAQSCCGDNLRDSIDDVSFIRELLYKFVDDINTQFPFLGITLSNLILFITGHSNGSFFIDKLAWIYANTNEQNINQRTHDGFPISMTAAAPISAFTYDNKEFLTDAMNGHNKVSIFYQHGDSDDGVDHKGCGCPDAKCCCHISQHSDVCVSLQDAYHRWLEWNQQVTTVESVDTYPADKVRSCTFNKGDDSGYLTWMCLWKGSNHRISRDTHVETDVLKSKVIEFFMHSLCVKGNYRWNDTINVCECGNQIYHYYCEAVTEIVEEEDTIVDDVLWDDGIDASGIPLMQLVLVFGTVASGVVAFAVFVACSAENKNSQKL
eukprot:544178_1